MALVAWVTGLFLAFYGYVLLRVRPELVYQQNSCVFLIDWYFFTEFLNWPGGLVEYASAFLSPWFAFNWLGALIVTLLVMLICVTTRLFIGGVTGRGGHLVFLVPSVLILPLIGQYCHPVRICVGLFAVLMLANAYVRIHARHALVRLCVFLLASLPAYYLTAGLYVVFAILCGIFEFLVRRQRTLGMVYALCAGAVPIGVGGRLFDLDVKGVYSALMLPTTSYWLALPSSGPKAAAVQSVFLMFFPVSAIVLAWARRHTGFSEHPAATSAGTGVATESTETPERSISRRRVTIQAAVLLALAIGLDTAFFDFPTRCVLQIAHSSANERWSAVLEHARRLPPMSPLVSDIHTGYYVNRALYRTGRLLESMFAYIQVADAPTLALVRRPIDTMAATTSMECSDILFELGRLNESEHMAHEAVERIGDRPHMLKRLAYIYVLKGQPEASRRFAAMLERSPLHREWATRWLRQLDVNPSLSGVPEIDSRRELILVQDAIGPLDLETMLQQLLERNPRNRTAFEYLMAHYLLTRRPDRVVANLHRFDFFDDPALPRHVEEALLISLETADSAQLDFGKRKVRAETQRRYSEFRQVLERYRGNPAVAFVALHRDFGDSYFFFHTFGHNDLMFVLSRRAI